MKTFDLELRITTFGSVITWEVLLEDATDHNKRILDWTQGKDYRYKKLPQFAVEDDVLSVFAGCQGITGGTLTCEVLINGVSLEKKLISKVEDTEYAKVDYQIA